MRVRYILDRRLEIQLLPHKDYLYQVFHQYFVETDRTSKYIELSNFPTTTGDVLFVYGHCGWVIEFFLAQKHQVTERIKVINSCYPQKVLPFLLPIQNVYYSKVNSRGEDHLRDGTAFGFDFDITDSELDLFNARHLPLMQQIQSAYVKVA